ncbi:MAG: GIY-YIG nuclease family protein [Shewanella sp.]
MKQPVTYILTSKPNGTLYIGVTSNLITRIWQHKNHITEGFTKKYGLTTLVYFELHGCIQGAILREKQLKKWRRKWNVELIDKDHPEWRELYFELI